MGDALLRRHAFTIVSGPTKCGKSVLCHRMLGPDRHVTVEGGQVPSADAFWLNLSHELGIPTTVQATRMRLFSLRGLAELAGGIPGVAQKKLSMNATAGGQDTEAATYSTMPTLAALRKLRRRDVTLVIEDFHYIAPATQRSIVRALKPAVSHPAETSLNIRFSALQQSVADRTADGLPSPLPARARHHRR